MPLVNNKRWKVYDENDPGRGYVCATRQEAEKVVDAILTIYGSENVSIKIDTIFPLARSAVKEIVTKTNYTEEDANILVDIFDNKMKEIEECTKILKHAQMITAAQNPNGVTIMNKESSQDISDKVYNTILDIKMLIRSMNVFKSLESKGITLEESEDN